AGEVDRVQRPRAARNFEPVRSAGNPRAHHLRRLHETDVSLNRIRSHAFNSYVFLTGSPRRHCAERYEVTSRRGVTLDMDGARRLVVAARRDGEALPTLAPHGDAKALKQIQGDLDVGLGAQLAHHLD